MASTALPGPKVSRLTVSASFVPFGIAKTNLIADTWYDVIGHEPLATLTSTLERLVLDNVRAGKPIPMDLVHIPGTSFQTRVESAERHGREDGMNAR